MKPTMFNRFVRMAAAAAFLASAACAAQNRDSERVSQVLNQARGHAVQAAIDANHLETYHMTRTPWQVHYYRLQQTGDDVRALARDLKQLQSLRDQASPTQLAVIDRFDTLLSGLTVSVSNARKYLVKNHDEVNMPTFHDQVRANYISIERVSAALCNCVKAENDRMLAQSTATPHPGKTAGPDCPVGPSMTTR